MAATRVYILAKELGVKSSAIVKKCQDEGLDIKNHMSVISAGLAATIHEWFSEGKNITTVETAKKVDLKKVRIKKKPKRKRLAKKAPIKSEPTTEAPAVAAEEPKPDTEQITEEPKEQQAPAEPEPILPAGPILSEPEPARLSGPQVVRVESPEPVRPIRPRRTKPRHNAPVTEPLMYKEQKREEPKSVPTKDAKTKDAKQAAKHYKERTHGRRREEQNVKVAGKSKFTKWRQRDIEERQARLNAARGEGLRLRPRGKSPPGLRPLLHLSGRKKWL